VCPASSNGLRPHASIRYIRCFSRNRDHHSKYASGFAHDVAHHAVVVLALVRARGHVRPVAVAARQLLLLAVVDAVDGVGVSQESVRHQRTVLTRGNSVEIIAGHQNGIGAYSHASKWTT
jgi:hypothetical protein